MFGAILGAAASIGSTLLGARSDAKANAQNIAAQKQFAKQGIQWKVADAKKAGVHPLFALGAQTHSFAPSSVGSDYSGLGAAGQQLGGAIDGQMSKHGQAGKLATQMAAIQIEGAALDNDIKRAQLASTLARAQQPGVGPGIPSPDGGFLVPGQGDGPQTTTGKLEIERKMAPHVPGQPHAEFGNNPEVAFYRTANGGYAPMVPQGLSESFEADSLSYLQWAARNKLAPGLGGKMSPPAGVPIPKGYEWKYSLARGEYYLAPKGLRYDKDGRLITVR